MAQNIKEGKLTVKMKLGYAAASMADACCYTFIGSFLMFFLTTAAGINPAAAGTIAAIGAFWDTLLSPVVGYISDNTRSKTGRRRPYLLFSAFPLGLATVMLYSVIEVPPGLKLLYYGFCIMLFWSCFACFFVPYSAFGAEITNDYQERTILRSYSYGSNLLGSTVGVVFPTIIIDYLYSVGIGGAAAWRGAALLVACCTVLTIMITWVATKEKGIDNRKTKEEKELEKKNGGQKGILFSIKNMVSEYWQVLKLKPTRFLISGGIFYLVANTIYASDRVYFYTYNVGLEMGVITWLLIITIIIQAVYIPFVITASRKLDKRVVFMLGAGLTTVGSLTAYFTNISSFWGAAAYAAVYACGNSCYWQLFPAMIYDVCEVDELVYGKRREGSVISLLSLSEAASAAITMQILGLVLEVSGFNGDAAVQSASALQGVRISFTLIPAAAIILCMIMTAKYPITKSNFNKIRHALEMKNQGKEVDMEFLKKIM